MHSHHHSDHPEHQHSQDSDVDGLPDLLDLDAQVFAEQLHDVRADIERSADGPVRTVLDLGTGTGTGTFGLLQHFPRARALAIDASDQMLERVRLQAEQLGLSDRLETVRVDLDHGLPSHEPVDLVWASASLHHLADPDRTLAQVAAAIRPGGLMAVVELTGFPRFLPDDAPGAAAEAKAHAVLDADRTIDMPAMGSDWGDRLARAGLVVVLERPIVIDLESPRLVPAAGAYAFATLTRIRGAVADRLEAADVELVDRLIDGGPDDVRRRTDLHVRAERQLHLARRPASST